MPTDALFLGGTSIDLIQENRYKGSAPVFMASVGGSITNSSIISAKLGLKTALLNRVGKDLLGDFAVELLNACKIDAKGIIRDSNIKTPLAIAKIDNHGVPVFSATVTSNRRFN
ncbi:MAG: PfkB family carbohydrate kinase [Candidatus Omnitrophota bacterium]|nr:PfkB family carbohydrate kinase [Candidatus Omnitrophota bacterium]